MNRFFITILLVISVITPVASFAGAPETQRIMYMRGQEQLFSVDFNDMWNIRMENGDITGVSDDGMIWFFLGDIKGQPGFEGARGWVTAAMAEYFTDIKVTDSIDEFDLNGLRAHAFQGTAEQEEKPVIFFASIFDASAERMGVLLFVMDPAAEKLYLDEIHRMAASITRH
ncbi:MAG: hypothetical protein ABH883_05555 [Candidatus Omnitrophota bacterium]